MAEPNIPEVHQVSDSMYAGGAKVQHEVHIGTVLFRGDVEENGKISVYDKNGDCVLLSATIEQVDDLIKILGILKIERSKYHGNEGPRK